MAGSLPRVVDGRLPAAPRFNAKSHQTGQFDLESHVTNNTLLVLVVT
jgi:hypothetical protein